jgi:Domain of unknown function (DUF4390)
VDTTVFSTRYCKNLARWLSVGWGALSARVERTGWQWSWQWTLWAAIFCGAGLPSAHAVDAPPAEVSSLRVERTEDGLYLSAALNIELPSVVEDALFKGVPMSFVSEADVYRDRWYWYDKRVATATRSVRLAFQPLTRRWRISVASGTIATPATGIALTQHFDNLNDAFAAIRRIARWKIADASDVSIDSRHNIDYRFRLDLSQLPRPLQIGVLGQNEWNISVERNVRPEMVVEPRTDSR